MNLISFLSDKSDRPERDKQGIRLLVYRLQEFFNCTFSEVRVHSFKKHDLHISFCFKGRWFILNIKQNETDGILVNGEIKDIWIE